MRRALQSLGVLLPEELPWGTFGIVGEKARGRHNDARTRLAETLRQGVVSATGIAGTMKLSADGYVLAESGVMQAVLAASDESWEADPTREEAPRTSSKPWQGVTLGVTSLAALGGTGLMALNVSAYGRRGTDAALARMPHEAARLEQLSQRTVSMLKVASSLSVTAASGLMLWLATATWHDEELDRAVTAWRGAAGALGELFGAGDPMKREALAAAWQGAAKDVADRKLRDFVAAGLQLADEAAGRALGLQDAVRHLNQLHEAAFWTTVVDLAIMIALRALGPMFPASFLASIKVGARLATALVLIQGVIVARLAHLAQEDLGRDTAGSAPEGVPETGFPRF